MAIYTPPYSNQDEYISGYAPTRGTTLESYRTPNIFPNQSPAYGRPTSSGFNSVSDYLTTPLQTQTPEPFKPTVTGIESLDRRFREVMPRAQYFQENNPGSLTRLPTNADVLRNQLKNSWGELGLGGQINAGASTIANLYQAYTGGREVKLAKAQMRFNKDAWNKEYANAVQDVNRSLRDRQQLRNYYNPDMYGNPDDYVAKYGAK